MIHRAKDDDWTLSARMDDNWRRRERQAFNWPRSIVSTRRLELKNKLIRLADA
jgi:hypothetical protein